MKINAVGITRIVPIDEHKIFPYKDLSDFGYTHIRERILKDGSTILLGYNDNQKLAATAQKYTSKNQLLRQNFFTTDTYGPQNTLCEKRVEKVLFNKIGDILKSKFKILNFEKNKLVKTQEITTDIINGIDRSQTIYQKNANSTEKELGLHIKTRISPSEYADIKIAHDGSPISRTTVIIDEPEIWKY